MKVLVLGTGMLLSAYTMAADNPLSVHVLNLQTGLPSSEVAVVLEQNKKGQWIKLNEKFTNENGRVTALYPDHKALEQGVYRVTFKTGDWFKSHNENSFFPEVPVIFNVEGAVKHYHIPLLLIPYCYSTYRGN